MELSNFSNLICSTTPALNIDPTNITRLTRLLATTIMFLKDLEIGLTIQDLQKFIFVVTFLRFFIYASYYNIKTGFYIASISFFSTVLWYIHFLYILRAYNNINLTNYFSANIWISYVSQLNDNYDRSIIWKTSQFGSRLFGIIKSYRIDPLSMIFSSIPDPIKFYSDKLYYTLWDKIWPGILAFLAQNVFISKMSFLYLLVVRYGKRYCPYLIRWHWTYVMMYTIITPAFIGIPYRLAVFSEVVLIPEERLIEYFYAKVLMLFIVSFHLLCILLPLLHALLGQYFFIPYLTRNVELHVGLRPKDSIYSGGYTAWQEYSIFLKEIGEEVEKPPLRFWWGWFGRGVKSTSKSRQNRQSLFNRLRRFIKNLLKIFNKST